MPDTRKLEFEVEIGATPGEIWQALTEAEGIKRWFAPEASVTPGAGGSVMVSWGPGAEGTAPIHLWEPGQRFGWTEGQKLVEFEIEAVEGGRTRLRLVQSGFGADAKFDDEVDSTHGGWLSYLAMLQYGAEHWRGQPMRQVHQMRMAAQPRAEAWERLLSAVGLGGSSGGVAEGGAYHGQLAGRAITGKVIRYPKPGYLILGTQSGMAALFLEKAGAAQSMLTIQWYAVGGPAIAEAESMKAALGEFADSFIAQQ